MNEIEIHVDCMTDDEAKSQFESWVKRRCQEWNLGKDWVPTQADDVLDAAKELQYAIRWFFHMFASWVGSGSRWQYLYWRYKVIIPWGQEYFDPVHMYDYIFNFRFMKGVLKGIAFLKKCWEWK